MLLIGKLENGLYILLYRKEASVKKVVNKEAIDSAQMVVTTFSKAGNHKESKDLLTFVNYSLLACTMDVWHQHLSHPSPRSLSQILQNCKASIQSIDKIM